MIIPCPSCNARYTLPDIALGGKPRKVHCSKCGHIWVQKPGDGLPDPKPRARPGARPGAKPAAKPVEAKPVLKKKKKKPAPVEPDDDQPLERFPGMGGFAGLGMGDDVHTEGGPTLGDDAWMNAGSHSVDFGTDDNESGDRRGLAAKVRDLGRWIGFAAAVAGLVVFVLADRTQIVELWAPTARLYEVIGLPVEPPGAGLQFQNVKSEQRLDNGATVLVLEGQIANVSTADRAVPAVIATSLGPDHKPVKSWRLMVTQSRLEPGASATFRSQERDPGVVADVAVTFAAE